MLNLTNYMNKIIHSLYRKWVGLLREEEAVEGEEEGEGEVEGDDIILK